MARRSTRKSTASAMASSTEKDNQKKSDFLSTNTIVEVCRDAEGFKSVWYIAKILKSVTRQKNKFLVQHLNLVSDRNPNLQLKETVSVSAIRPPPPSAPAGQTYEVSDVVDVFHRNGWWKGVVSKVSGTLYTVVFENPPEKLNFFPGNLRFHYFWSGGIFVRSPKQKRMKGLNIEKGTAVEVNLNGEISQNAWSPAIVVDEVGFNSFLVKCCRSKTDDDEDVHTTETVESFYIRPSPPKFEVQNFEILEMVDAFHGSCWKKGTINATLTHGRYNVFLDSEEEEFRFVQSEIRPHLVWKDDKWIGFREIPKATVSETVDSVKSSSTEKRKTPDATDDAYETSSVKKSRKNAVDIEEFRKGFGVGQHDKGNETSGEQTNVSSVKKSRKNAVDIEEFRKGFGVVQHDKGNETSGEQKNVAEAAAAEMEFENCASNKEAELPTEMDIENGDAPVITRSVVPGPDNVEPVGIFYGGDDGDLPTSGEHQNVSEDAVFESTDMEKEVSGYIIPVADHTAEVADGVSDDRALSKCVGRGDQEGRVENLNQADADGELVKNQDMPFVKTAALWQYLDSHEVFKILPQKPHYAPLFEVDEIMREGCAIGHMLTFTFLVDGTSKLTVETQRKVYESYFTVLAGLETHGFDVKPVVERLEKLLAIKAQQDQLVDETKGIQFKLAEFKGERAKWDKEINAVQKKISELKEQLALILSERAATDHRSDILQIDFNNLNAAIVNAEQEFQRLVAAPW
ncbi:DUF724 domain-containing protein 2-like [Euphorbia lathyris]|uniref:DUF724 domain-containing protein 2-like n=1 Tax=Euphorbia lathyris TaxID=212925 RepID=UPI0033142ACB